MENKLKVPLANGEHVFYNPDTLQMESGSFGIPVPKEGENVYLRTDFGEVTLDSQMRIVAFGRPADSWQVAHIGDCGPDQFIKKVVGYNEAMEFLKGAQPHTTYASAPNIIETKAPVFEGPADMSREAALEARIEALEISMDKFEAGQGRFVRFVRNELVKAGLLKQDGEPMVTPDVAPSKTPPPSADPSDERMREMFNGTLSKTVRMYLGESAPEPIGWNAFMIFGYKLWICVSDIERCLNEARSKAYQEPFTTKSE